MTEITEFNITSNTKTSLKQMTEIIEFTTTTITENSSLEYPYWK